MITIDEITGEIVPEERPAAAHSADGASRVDEARFEERLRDLLARQRHRRRRLSDR